MHLDRRGGDKHGKRCYQRSLSLIHIDVYKRQEQRRPPGIFQEGEIGMKDMPALARAAELNLQKEERLRDMRHELSLIHI